MKGRTALRFLTIVGVGQLTAWHAYAAPANDAFAQREVISGFSNTVSGSNVGATREIGEPAPSAPRSSGRSVWWTWTSPFSGKASANTVGTQFPNYLEVRVGTNLSTLTLLASGASQETNLAVISEFSARAGEAYNLLVDGLDGAAGEIRLSVILKPGPPNDDFAKRTALSGTNLAFAADNRQATREPGEPPGASGRSVWWSWLAPGPGSLMLRASSATGPASFTCLRGSALTGLTQLSPRMGSLNLRVTNGIEYAILMDGEACQAQLSLSFQQDPAPAAPNDFFTNRLVLEGMTASFSGSARQATREPGESSTSGQSSMWWSWTPPASGEVVFTLSTPNFFPRLAVFTGETLPTLQLVGFANCCNNATFGQFYVRRGRSYSIAVGSSSGAGEFIVGLTLKPAPPNDDFNDRIFLPEMTNATSPAGPFLASTAAGSNRLASLEPNEPPLQSPRTIGATVWWSWVAPVKGRATLEVTTTGSSGPIVGIFTGSVLSNLVRVTSAGSSFPGVPTRLTFDAVAGVQYQFGVDSEQPADLFLRVLEYPTPDNDLFANAAPLLGENLTAIGTLNVASVEAGEPAHGSSGSSCSVWYKWVALSDGPVTIDLVSQIQPGPALTAAAYIGETLTSLALVTNRTDNARTRLTFLASAGQTYRLAVASLSSGAVPFALTLKRDVPPQVRIIDPLTPEVIATGNPIRIVAEATDAVGSVRQVEFLVGGQQAAVLNAAPFSFLFTNQEPRSYDVMAVATDDAGLTSASSVLWIKFPPDNDAFAARRTLLGFPVSDSGTTGGATREPGEPWHAGYQGYASLWWSWTAPSSGEVVADLRWVDNWSPSLLAVYTGESLASLTPVASVRSLQRHRAVIFQATAQTTYHLAVDAESNRGGPFALALYSVPNDYFTNRTRLSGLEAVAVGHNLFTTNEPGEPTSFAFSSSVWWSWLSPVTQSMSLTCSNDFVAELRVFIGSEVTQLTQVAQSIGSPTSLRFDATAGTEYQISVNGLGGGMGDIALGLTPVPIPGNDAFELRWPASSGDNSGSTLGASAQPGEPPHNAAPPSRSVWWTWTAAARGFAQLSFSNTYTATVALYTGSTLQTLSPIAGTNGSTGVLGFPVSAGVTYQIAFGGGEGQVRFNLDSTPYPNHDDFANAWVIQGTTNRLRSSNVDATPEPWENPMSFHSVWWNWSPLVPGNYSISAEVAGSGAVLLVYEGPSPDLLRQVAGHVQLGGPPAIVTFYARPETNYWIRVDGAGASTGEILLSVFPNDPPLIQVTSPQAGAVLPAGTPVQLTVAASDTNSFLTYSDLFLDASFVPLLSSPGTPLTTNVLLPIGLHTVVARAVDNFSVITTSAPVHFRVALTNDDFAWRPALSGWPIRVQGRNLGATAETEEPMHAGLSAAQSVWWTWTAPTSGVVAIDVVGLSVDPTLAVYAAGAELNNLVLLAANNDASPMFDLNSRIRMNAVAGSNYVIAVDTAGLGGDLVLSIASVPPNDDFEKRLPLSGASTSTTASNQGASRQPEEPIHAGRWGSRSLWWEWFAPASASYTIETSTNDFDTLLAVYTGSALSLLTPVAADDDGNPGAASRLHFVAQAGTAYQIALDGSHDASGRVNLRIRPDRAPSLSNVSLHDAILTVAVTGEAGRLHRLETSTNLVDWLTIRTFATGDGTLLLSNSVPPRLSQQFFRTLLLP